MVLLYGYRINTQPTEGNAVASGYASCEFEQAFPYNLQR